MAFRAGTRPPPLAAGDRPVYSPPMLDATLPPKAPTPLYVSDAARPNRRAAALEDLATGLRRWRLAAALARLDIRNRYRGSVLGPFWLTLSTGVMVLGLGFLYSSLFKLPLADYLPFIAVSLIVWNMISQTVTDAGSSLTSAEGIIRQMPLPFSIHVLRCVFRNMLITAHSLPLILVIFLVTGTLPGPEVALLLPGLLLVAVNAFSVALLLGMVCARFRDIVQIVNSVMQLAFFMSPVIWKPELLGERAVWLPLNPFYALMETVRGPLVEGGVPGIVWLAAIGYTLLGGAVALAFFVRFRSRIAFWV